MSLIQKQPNYTQDARYPWEVKYFAAILEANDMELAKRVADANSAISDRLEAMKTEKSTADEQKAIADALAGLKRIVQERLSRSGS